MVAIGRGSGSGLAWLGGRAGAEGVGGRVSLVDEGRWEGVAGAVESGLGLWAEVEAPRTSQCAGPDVQEVARPVLDGWHRVGLPASGLSELTLLAPAPVTGVPDAVRPARATLATVARAAELIAERAEG